MHVERNGRRLADGFTDGKTKGKVRHKVPVHDVDVVEIGTAGFNSLHLRRQIAEVTGEQGGSDFDHVYPCGPEPLSVLLSLRLP